MRFWFRLPYVDIRLSDHWSMGFDLGMFVVGINFWKRGFIVTVPFVFVEYER